MAAFSSDAQQSAKPAGAPDDLGPVLELRSEQKNVVRSLIVRKIAYAGFPF